MGKQILCALCLFLGTIDGAIGQVNVSPWFSDEIVHKKPSQSFPLGENLHCIFGIGFWMIYNVSDSSAVRGPIMAELEYMDGYLLDSTIVLLGQYNNTDVLNRHFAVVEKYDFKGNLLERKRTYGGYQQAIQAGLIRVPNALNYIIKEDGLWKEGDTSYVMVDSFHWSNRVQGGGLKDSLLILAFEDGIYQYIEGKPLELILPLKGEKVIHTKSEDGIYLMHERHLILFRDLTQIAEADTVTKFNFIPHYHGARFNSGSFLDQDKLTFLNTSDYHRKSITQNLLLSIKDGTVVDSFNLATPTFKISCLLYKSSPLTTVGEQTCCGDYSKTGFLELHSDNQILLGLRDLSISLSIDSSYWKEQVSPAGVIRNHNWVYTVTLTNEGMDTIYSSDVFQPYAAGVFNHVFRSRCDFKGILPPGESKRRTCRESHFLPESVKTEFCMAADFIDGYLDEDYSNNMSCANIPYPKPLQIQDYNPQEVRIFPSPSEGLITLTTPQGYLPKGIYEIWSTQGVKLYSQSHNSNADYLELFIERSGLYVIRLVKADTSILVGKIVIN